MDNEGIFLTKNDLNSWPKATQSLSIVIFQLSITIRAISSANQNFVLIFNSPSSYIRHGGGEGGAGGLAGILGATEESAAEIGGAGRCI